MKIFSGLIAFLIFASYSITGQNGTITFEETTHDYGKLQESIQKATHRFIFTNTGNGNLKLVNVKASCGCTATDYSKGEIKPGEKGFVESVYYTAGRPGVFRKSITVTTNDPDKPNTVLFIKGDVISTPKNPCENLPFSMGNLKLQNNTINLGDLGSNASKTDSIQIYNAWTNPMQIGFMDVPAHLKMKAVPEILESGKIGYIYVTYDAKAKNDFGVIFDRVAIKTNDNVQPLKTLNITLKIFEDFSVLTPKDLKKAPIAHFETMDYNYGQVKAGELIKFKFIVHNEGKNDLIIRKVKASCGCTATKLDNTIVKKGKTAIIEVEYDTKGQTGLQHKTITVTTNDPKSPEIVLNIHGEAIKP